MAGMADVQALYKIRYEPTVRDQLNKLVDVRYMIQRVPPSGPMTGQFTREPIVTGQSGGEGFVGPEPVIPLPDSPSVANTDVYIMEWWGAVSISQRAISAAKNDEGAFLRIQSFHMTDMREKAMFTLEMNACGDGTGLLATVTTNQGAAGANAIAVGDTTFRVSRLIAARLRKNERIEFWSGNTSAATKFANPAAQDWYKITTVNTNLSATEAEVTIDPPFAFAVANLTSTPVSVVKDEARKRIGSTTFTNVQNGLRALIDNSDTNRMQPNVVGSDVVPTASTLQNISAASEPLWSSTVKAANGDDFSPQVLEDVFSELASFSARGREGIKFILVNPIQTNIWRKNRYPEQRVMMSRADERPAFFPTGTPSATANNKTYLQYSDIPIVESRLYEPSEAALVSDTVKYFELEPFQAWDPAARGPHPSFSRKSALDQEFFLMEQLGTVGRNQNARITGLSTSL